MNSLNLPPIMQALNSSLQDQQPVLLAFDQQGAPTIKTMGLLSRCWHWNDKAFHRERLSKLVPLVTQILESQDRLSIKEAANDPCIRIGRELYKSSHLYNVSSPEIEALNKQVTAAKLGIRAEVFDKNPGFQKFVEDTYLFNYLLEYGDDIKLDPMTQEIAIRKSDTYCPWKEVYQEMQSWPKSENKPSQPWLYGPEGICNEDMYRWTELKPFKKGDPAEWNHQYVFEFCMCYNPRTIKNGNHSWLRLKTPTGDIYSVGLYRPGKPDLTHNLRKPFRIKQGYLMQPDVSEFWQYKIYTIDVAITEQDFLKMKKTIEKDKEDQHMLFQLFNNNCLLYIKKIGAIAGIDLPTEESILELVTPPSWKCKVKAILGRLPQCIQKICHIVTAFFVNLGQLALGAGAIDADLNEKQKMRAEPHLKSLKDLFDPHKMVLDHPRTLAFNTREKVMAWRKKKLEKLQMTESDPAILVEKSKKIALSLPKVFYSKKMANEAAA